jgi:NADH dehydrogenase
MDSPHRVVIVGGGFGGLEAARCLRSAPVEITLVDRRNFHLFQPLLYQVATGGLSPANIAAPLRSVLKRQRNCRVWLGEAAGIDVAGRRLLLRDGTVPYDTLIVAAGAQTHYFGRDDWASRAPGLKSFEDAVDIRRRVLRAFEAAERDPDPAARQAWLTFVVIGAGPTGVELSGAIAELAHHTLVRDFRSIDTTGARILLLEAADRVLPPYPPVLSDKARAALGRLGVTVRLGTRVTDIRDDRVVVRANPEAPEETIPARTALWTAGIRATPLARALAEASGAETDAAGRIRVLPDLTLPGHPELFAIGDMATCTGPDGRALPGIAPVAVQQARQVARTLRHRLAGRPAPPAFAFIDRGQMATVGRAAAVAMIGRLRFNGVLAWLAWLLIHLMAMVRFENRVLVLVQWAWNYATRNRAARLITEEPPPVAAP